MIKKKILMFLSGIIIIVALSGCSLSSAYTKKSYQNITTAFLDGNSSEEFLRGN